jgi:hypothetical protein
LKEGIEGGRRTVVVLVEGRGGRLDTLGVGWKTSVLQSKAGQDDLRCNRPSSN